MESQTQEQQSRICFLETHPAETLQGKESGRQDQSECRRPNSQRTSSKTYSAVLNEQNELFDKLKDRFEICYSSRTLLNKEEALTLEAFASVLPKQQSSASPFR